MFTKLCLFYFSRRGFVTYSLFNRSLMTNQIPKRCQLPNDQASHHSKVTIFYGKRWAVRRHEENVTVLNKMT